MSDFKHSSGAHRSSRQVSERGDCLASLDGQTGGPPVTSLS